MKKIVALLLLTTFWLSGFSISEKVRVGLHFSPGIAWSKPFGKDLQKGAPRFGASYGFIAEYWFAKNYGLATGLNGAYDGCNLKSRDAFQRYDTQGNVIHTVNEKYSFHYLEIPAYLKLKTNDIKGGKFCIWGQVGVNLNITVSARATFSDSISTGSGNILIEKENIMKKKNEVANVIPNFQSNFFDVRLGGGAGFECKFDERTALLVGVFYHNGFINNIFDRDIKREANVMRMFSMRVGVLF